MYLRHILEICFKYIQNGYDVVLMSGRSESAKTVTEAWLNSSGIKLQEMDLAPTTTHGNLKDNITILTTTNLKNEAE